MKKKNLFLLLISLFLFFITTSCSQNELSSIIEKSTPEYDTKRQVIYDKEELSQDIKVEIELPLNRNTNFDLGFEFYFFNYGQDNNGEDISLNRCCVDDRFIQINKIKYIYLVQNLNDIYISHKGNSKKYGEWAIADVYLNNKIFKNVFITPLAMKAHKEREEYCYIFTQFVNSGYSMNIICCGGYRESHIVSSYQNYIIKWRELYSSAFNTKNPGKFWQKDK